jgi:antitoxin (DNA-binding transcriptional repressor) of toxin-antitoxin stability system
MAIQTNAPDKRNSLQDLVAAALRGEKVVLAVNGEKQAAPEAAEPKPDEEAPKPEES